MPNLTPEKTYAELRNTNRNALKRLRKALRASNGVYVYLSIDVVALARQMLPKAELLLAST